MTGTSRLRNILTEHEAVHLWGFPIIFRLKSDGNCDKLPIVAWKHLQAGPPMDEEIADWCSRFPYASAGIPSGPGPGTFIVDTDSVEGAEYVEKRGLPRSWRVRTPRGWHDFFQWPNFIVRNSVKQLGPFDIRGLGGYSAAPGSRYQPGSGRLIEYHWERGYSPRDLPLAKAPDWLLGELYQRFQMEQQRIASAVAVEPRNYPGRMSSWGRRAFEENLRKLAAAPSGERNKALFDVSRRFGQLSAGGEIDGDSALEPVYVIAEAWGNVKHSKSTIDRAFAMGQASPRSAKRP
jgi:hypothetical protein